MDVNEYQTEIVKIVELYGRPPTMGAHLEKLGEEVGELAHAVYSCGATCCPDVEESMRKLELHIAEECCDIINVCTSLIDMTGCRLDQTLRDKIYVLKERITNGRRDRKFGNV